MVTTTSPMALRLARWAMASRARSDVLVAAAGDAIASVMALETWSEVRMVLRNIVVLPPRKMLSRPLCPANRSRGLSDLKAIASSPSFPSDRTIAVTVARRRDMLHAARQDDGARGRAIELGRVCEGWRR